MRWSLTLFMGGLLRIFLMDTACNRTPPGPVRIGEIMGLRGSNLAELERETGYTIKVNVPKKSDQRDNNVFIQGTPGDVEHWGAVILERYRGRKIKPKVVYRSTILIMTAMTIAAVVNSMVITNILHIKAALGCP